jgi:hypothetical protein
VFGFTSFYGLWNRVLAPAMDLISALREAGRPVVFSWGFPVQFLNLVRRLIDFWDGALVARRRPGGSWAQLPVKSDRLEQGLLGLPG